MTQAKRDPIEWLEDELGELTILYDLAGDDAPTDPFVLYPEYLAVHGFSELEDAYAVAVGRGTINPLPPDVTLEQAVAYVIDLYRPDRLLDGLERLRAALKAHGPGATIGDLAAARKLPQAGRPDPFSIHGYRAAQQRASA